MDRHGGRVRPRAAGAAERNCRRSRHGGGRVRCGHPVRHLSWQRGRSGRQSEHPGHATSRVALSALHADQRAVRDPAGRPQHCDHRRRGGIDRGSSSKRAASSNLIPPPANTNAARRRALPFSADPRDRDRSAGCARRSDVRRDPPFRLSHACFRSVPCFSGAAFGSLPLSALSPCWSRCPGKRRSLATRRRNDGRAEARRQSSHPDACGAGCRRACGPATRLGRRSRSAGETDGAQACRS